MNAGLSDAFFWVSLMVSLILAGIAAFPVNRWLIRRGEGHALYIIIMPLRTHRRRLKARQVIIISHAA